MANESESASLVTFYSHGIKEALRRKSVFLIYLFTAVWLLAWFSYGYGYWEDDAFIHLEFARSLFQGHGFSFAGVVANGDTSPLWVFLLAGVHYLIPDWMTAGKLLMLASCIAALSAFEMVARKLAPMSITPRLFAAIVVLLLAINPYFLFWFQAGMETLMAIAFGLWIIWAASIASVNWTSFWIGCLLAGLAPLLRPEFVLLDVIVAPFMLVHALRLTQGRSIGVRIGVLISAGLLAAEPLIAWVVYAHTVFGTIIPNTSAAKCDLNGGSVISRLVIVFSFGFPLIAVFTVAFPFIVGVCRLYSHSAFNRLAYQVQKLPPALWIVVAWSFVTCALYIVNHTYIQTRYVLVFAPALMLAILILIFSFERKSISYAACIGTGLAALAISLAVVRPFIRNKVERVSKTRELAEFLKTRLPPGKPVAVYAIGQLGFQSGHPIIDTGGIINPAVVPFANSVELRMEWAEQQGAAYLVGGEDDHPGPQATLIYESSAPFAGWTIHLSDFREREPIRVWALPPQTGMVGQKAAPPSSGKLSIGELSRARAAPAN